jgi:hypothetical protein
MNKEHKTTITLGVVPDIHFATSDLAKPISWEAMKNVHAQYQQESQFLFRY